MNLRKIHQNMMYDEFGKKDYEGYVLLICMLGYVFFPLVLALILIYL